jgi:hypothetical protein
MHAKENINLILYELQFYYKGFESIGDELASGHRFSVSGHVCLSTSIRFLVCIVTYVMFGSNKTNKQTPRS